MAPVGLVDGRGMPLSMPADEDAVSSHGSKHDDVSLLEESVV